MDREAGSNGDLVSEVLELRLGLKESVREGENNWLRLEESEGEEELEREPVPET